MSVSARSLESLDFPRILSLIGALAATDVGRLRVASLRPVRGEELARRRAELTELADILSEGTLVAALDEPITELWEELNGSRPDLDGRKLVRWSRVLATARLAVETLDEARPALHAIVRDLPDLGWLEERIQGTLDERGDVRDDASPALQKLRRRIARLRKTTYARLQETLDERGEVFSQDTIPFHNGRLVLMLRSGERGRVEGLVHGSSASGRSLYFEPMAAVESNNELQEAVAGEEVERRRLLRELVEAIIASREAIGSTLEALARLDGLQAVWRFGDLIDGRLVEISDGDLVLKEARHPLLAPATRTLREAVLGSAGHAGGVTPLDLELVGDGRVLVVTGPNAGGKTVALKTTGLVVTLTLCGVPAPVAPGSRIPEVGTLVAVVGDEQDLMQDRSTFSGRLLRLEEAWSAAGPESLVLLDELGSGTDPHEGAALSVALVERLAATSTASLVTTHLLAVAAAAAELEGATCASMEFDHESRLPTYRLLAGPPGGSEAIALARQLELPAEWLDRAEALVGEEHGRLRRLLAEVETVRSELLAEKEGQRRLRQEAAVERQTLAAERKKLVDERRRVAAAAKREIEAFRRRVRERMDHEVRSAREAVEAGRSRTVAADAVRKLFDDAPAELVAPIGGENGRDEELEVGDQVRHVDFTWEGRLESLEGSRATVSIAGKRFECDAGDLRSAPASAPSKSGRGARGRGVEVPSRDVELPVELDLIGQRVEPALEALDRYLDQALLVPYMEVRVVHGHGTGRLRRGIREFLAGHAAVAGVRPGRSNEGGDGVTVVRLAS